MMEKWTPLTEKYGCSPANLVIRYTASAIKNLNILCGARKPEQMLRQILPLLSIYPLCRLLRKIPCIQLIILPFLLHELVMGSSLDDPSLFQDHNTVRIPHC